ncbi:MAG TPA: GTP-binding protein [Negativicutes bacterium]|nr:GTP-binding protein [Negativicutes bacterium]
MRILLFGGFLGSGKTSIILQLARQITVGGEDTVAIIENEIGEQGIDDKLLSAGGFTVKPLFGGCVCCQITGDLLIAVEEIARAITPGWLIIEMTGLAVPGNVAKLIRQYNATGAKCKTITVVDASRWAELKEVLAPLVDSQVKDSDLVIVNKADLAGSEINKTVDDVRAIAGQATILTACAADHLPRTLLEEVFHLE